MATYVFAGNMMVCQIRGWGHLTGVGALNLPEDEAIAIQEANGKLIAAAPDLLAVLKEAIAESGCDGDLCMHRWHDTARTAIAKAEGRA